MEQVRASVLRLQRRVWRGSSGADRLHGTHSRNGGRLLMKAYGSNSRQSSSYASNVATAPYSVVPSGILSPHAVWCQALLPHARRKDAEQHAPLEARHET